MTPDAAPDSSAPAPAAPAVAARYFDGLSSRPWRVGLRLRGDAAEFDGEASRSCPLHQLRLSERSRHAVRRVTFPDGAYLEIDDNAAFERLLGASGQRDGWVVRLQQSWRGALLAGGACVLALLAGYQYLLPLAAGAAAAALPPAVERRLGDGVLAVLDARMFAPSQLPAARQRALRASFAALAPPLPGVPPWRLQFRASRIGPNAFALPSGDIVLTDQMVALLDDEAALMGVLAHELGHLHERHLMRRVIQGAAITATTSLLLGDVSSVLAALPALALDAKYSRDAEREADDYAAAMLRRNGIGLEHLAAVFAKLEQAQAAADAPAHAAAAPPGADYLSSHPSSAERIARLRAAGRR
jgi:Zn-dependent protease with chaperone function